MEALAKANAKVKLRIIDIGDWKSPVVRQHRIEGVPALWLYEDGRLYSKDNREVGARLQALK